MKSRLSLLVLSYLRFWARLMLKKNPRAIIVGITGSAGKTSTRLAVVEILKTRGIVKHSIHANSESGIPLNILGLSLGSYTFIDWLRVIILSPLRYFFYHEHYDFYVVEMGIDSPYPPKNMDYLLTILKPDIAVVLGASHVHTAGFDTMVKDTNPVRRAAKLLELIASHKMLLAKAVSGSGTAIVNIDNPALTPHLKDIRSRILTIGKDKKSNIRIVKTKLSSHGFSTTYEYDHISHELALPDVFGLEFSSTFAAALAVGVSLGISIEQGIKALKNYRAPAGRMRVFRGQKGTHIIDSSYNASPDTMESGLNTLDYVSPRGNHILVLGDMRELGTLSKPAHQRLAKKLASRSDIFILYGDMMSRYVAPYLKREKKKVYSPSSMKELIEILKKSLKPNTWILFKGSQNTIFLERAVESILAHKEDTQLLPRRGSFWDKKRREAT